MQATSTGSEALPTAYTGCHAHGSELYCISPSGDEVLAEADIDSADQASQPTTTAPEATAVTAITACHMHGTVQYVDWNHRKTTAD